VMLETPVGRELQDLTRSFNTMSEALATDERRRQRDIQRAREIQQHLLPNGVSIPVLTIARDYQPAEHVAGDYYDLLPLADGSWLLVIADVAGHGISAAMAATLLKALLLCESEISLDPTTILARVNRRMTSLLPTGVFVTMLLAVWNPNERRLTYVNAGHPPGLLWNPRDGFRELAASAFPVGVMPEVEYVARELTLTASDRLVLVTDGLLEAFAPTGELFGADRLQQLIVNHASASPSELLNAILSAVRLFTGNRPLQDDLTLLIASPWSDVRTNP
jgi:sigma-B regulation protein RsbU (phosphoserine phosphatase)